jgi:hypothetical protein
MKPTLDPYQSDPSRQPDRIQRHIRRGEAIGRFLLRFSSCLRQLYRRMHGGVQGHGRDDEPRPTVHVASVLNVKGYERKAAKAQGRSVHGANDEDYRSVA